MPRVPEITDEIVEEAASRLVDALPRWAGWEETSEDDRERFRVAARVLLFWLHVRPAPH